MQDSNIWGEGNTIPRKASKIKMIMKRGNLWSSLFRFIFQANGLFNWAQCEINYLFSRIEINVRYKSLAKKEKKISAGSNGSSLGIIPPTTSYPAACTPCVFEPVIFSCMRSTCQRGKKTCDLGEKKRTNKVPDREIIKRIGQELRNDRWTAGWKGYLRGNPESRLRFVFSKQFIWKIFLGH